LNKFADRWAGAHLKPLGDGLGLDNQADASFQILGQNATRIAKHGWRVVVLLTAEKR
jgi:hypothetical protein